MEASSPSTSGPSPMTFAVPAATTRSVAALGGAVGITAGPSATTLEALHVAAARRGSRTRTHHTDATRATRARTRLTSTLPQQQSESSRSGPNTRSRKRRVNETQTSPPAQASTAPAPKKRARAKPINLKKPPPQAKEDDSDKKPSPACNCCICMCEVEPDDLAGISGCEHRFCFGCIEKWAERENTCPLCKNRFNKIDRINKKKKKGQKNTKKVKQRDQRSDLVPGVALEGLLANFASRNPPSIARLIFSGIGNLDFNSLHGPSARFSRARAMARGDDDSDEEESPLSSFIRAFHGHGMPVMQVVQPVTFSTRIAGRNYASNGNDRNAGRGAENPLEIDDSDDDEVEVWTANGRS